MKARQLSPYTKVFVGALVSTAAYVATRAVQPESGLDIREAILFAVVFVTLSPLTFVVVRAAGNDPSKVGLPSLLLAFIVWGWASYGVGAGIGTLAPELTGRPSRFQLIDFWLSFLNSGNLSFAAMLASGGLSAFGLLRNGRALLTDPRGRRSIGHRLTFIAAVGAAVYVVLNFLTRLALTLFS